MEDLKFAGEKPAKIQTWKVKEGFFLPVGHVIFSYVELDKDGQVLPGLKRLKTTQSGVIKQILVKNGQVVSPGSTLATLEPCSHPTVMRDMCAECGKDLRKLDEPAHSAAVSMIHSVPDLRVSHELAQKIGKVDEDRLLKQKKLVLLVDLDQTVIHTTNDNVPHNLKDVFHFQLWGHGSVWYHTRLRPRTLEFLEAIEKLYELHICTFGTRSYAHVIARHVDPLKKYFSDRILSRDECFSQNSKTANLKELFPRGDHMVCIIDDREDVWNFAPNLIHVKPYHFFRHTGDINAPPGLTKQDEDDKTGFTFDKDGTAVKAPEQQGKEADAVDGIEDTEGLNCDQSVENNQIEDQNSEKVDAEIGSSSKVRNVTSDLSLSDEEEDSDGSGKSEDADEADKEESGDEKAKPAEKSSSEQTETNVPDDVEKPAVISDSSITTTAATASENSDTLSKDAKTEVIDIVDGTKSTDVMEVEDQDDYLIYLEHILTSIHEAFYSLYNDMRGDNSSVPDVKNVIPYVRRKVLKNVSIVFSGVVPTEVPLSERKNTKAYSVAMSLGAHVSERIIPPNKPSASSEIPTTHIVAVRMGTAKVNEARRYKGIYIVSPAWLWCCSERWEHVDERLFQLYKKSVASRNPPGHHHSSPQKRRDSPNAATPLAKNGQIQAAARKERTPSGRFMDTINPLLSFSMDEIDAMGHEVDDIINESESSSSSEEGEVFKETNLRRKSISREIVADVDQSVSELTRGSSSGSNSSDLDSETEGLTRNRKRKRKNRTETETEDEPIGVKFRRGEAVPSEVEHLMYNSDDEGTMDQEEQSQEEWMANELERQFMDDSSQDVG